MPKLALILALATLFCAAQVTPEQRPDSAPFRTAGFCNGRFWRLLDDQSKLAWVEAYSNGVTFAVFMTFSGGPGDPALPGESAIQAKIESLFPSLTWGEVRTALDRFYDSPENGPIPVPEALQVLTMKVAGADQSAIDKRISAIRQIAIKSLQDSSKH